MASQKSVQGSGPGRALVTAKHVLGLAVAAIGIVAAKLLEEVPGELGKMAGEYLAEQAGLFLLLLTISQIIGAFVAPKIVQRELKPLVPAVAVLIGQFLMFLIVAIFGGFGILLRVVVDIGALGGGLFWLLKHEHIGVLFVGAYELIALASPLVLLFGVPVGNQTTSSVVTSLMWITWRMVALILLAVGHLKIRRQLQKPSVAVNMPTT